MRAAADGARLTLDQGVEYARRARGRLSHIFTELDTANRAQLAAAAIDRGLPAGRRVPDPMRKHRAPR